MSPGTSIARADEQAATDTVGRQPALGPLASPQNFKHQAYVALKNAIAAMDIYRSRAEIRLDERRLAQEFGVSRTPVREAMAQLECEGFVRSVFMWCARPGRKSSS
jgi:Bacterial regulatory proteins, gntR family